jgi:uncharacterized protein (UPF0297 family)
MSDKIEASVMRQLMADANRARIAAAVIGMLPDEAVEIFEPEYIVEQTNRYLAALGLDKPREPEIPDGAPEVVEPGHGRVHDLKIWPQHFDEILGGEKMYELRRDDRKPRFQPGDTLRLREWSPESERYLARETWVRVLVVRRRFPGMKDGYALLSIRPCSEPEAACVGGVGPVEEWDIDESLVELRARLAQGGYDEMANTVSCVEAGVAAQRATIVQLTSDLDNAREKVRDYASDVVLEDLRRVIYIERARAEKAERDLASARSELGTLKADKKTLSAQFLAAQERVGVLLRCLTEVARVLRNRGGAAAIGRDLLLAEVNVVLAAEAPESKEKS